jgi:hypothetical protein
MMTLLYTDCGPQLVQNKVVFGFTALKVHGILTNKAEAWK